MLILLLFSPLLSSSPVSLFSSPPSLLPMERRGEGWHGTPAARARGPTPFGLRN